MRVADVHVSLSTGYARADLVRLAMTVEDLGFGGLWLTELSAHDAFSVLTEIALKTRQMELGTGIVNHFGRSPATLAQSAASLSEVLQGRAFNLGLGASSRTVIEGLHGMPFDRPFARMADTLALVRLALSGEPLNFSGEVFITRGFTLGVKSAGPVRLYVGGFAPKMLAVTGQHADGWLPNLPSRRGFGTLREQVRSAAGTAGRPMPTTAAYLYTMVGPDASEAEEPLRRTVAWYIASGGEGYRRLFRSYGYTRLVDEIVALWRDGKRAEARALVTSEVIRDVCLVGAAEEVPAQLQTFMDIGIDTPVIRFPDPLEPERQLSMLRGIASALSAT
jgi:probable F420-dependent oxidoreductase